jgi:hypothetical protein
VFVTCSSSCGSNKQQQQQSLSNNMSLSVIGTSKLSQRILMIKQEIVDIVTWIPIAR